MKTNKSTQLIAGSVLAFAAISPCMANGFSGQMDFSGTITSTLPQWVWEINQAAQTENNALDFDQATASIVGGNLVWEIFPQNGVWLTGYLDKAITSKTAIMNPQISMNGTALTGTEADISIQASGGGTLTITAAAVAGYSMVYDNSTYFASSTGIRTAHGVYTPSPDFQQAFLVPQGNIAKTLHLAVGSQTPADTTLGRFVNSETYEDYATNNYSATRTPNTWWYDAYAADGHTTANGNIKSTTAHAGAVASTIKLSYPKSSVPSTWTATLPITVAIL